VNETLGGYDIPLLRRTRAQIGEEIANKSVAVIEKMAAGKDDAFCRAQAGRIQGLRDALTMMDEIAKELTGEPRSKEGQTHGGH
jgi:hypothetical protein